MRPMNSKGSIGPMIGRLPLPGPLKPRKGFGGQCINTLGNSPLRLWQARDVEHRLVAVSGLSEIGFAFHRHLQRQGGFSVAIRFVHCLSSCGLPAYA